MEHQTKDSLTTQSNIYFCEQPRVTENDRLGLPKWKKEAIRKLQAIDERRNIRLLVMVAMWIFSGGAVAIAGSSIVSVLGCFTMGVAIMGISVFMHEAAHHLMFKNHSLNRMVGFLCGAPALISVSAYRSVHMLHHAHERTEKDPDDIEAPAKSVPLVLFYYLFLMVGTYLYIPHVAVNGFRLANSGRRKMILVEYFCIGALLTCVLAAIPVELVLKFWLIPLVVASQLTNFRGIAEHGLTTGGNPFTATRSVISNRSVSFLMCNLNYHLEHHLFPGVPWYNLPGVQALLQEEYRKAGSSVYHSYSEFYLDFFRLTWKRRIVPNARMIPSHVLNEVCA